MPQHVGQHKQSPCINMESQRHKKAVVDESSMNMIQVMLQLHEPQMVMNHKPGWHGHVYVEKNPRRP